MHFMRRPNVTDECVAILLGHANVADHHVGFEFGQHLDCLGDRIRGDYFSLTVRQRAFDERPAVGLVIDDKNSQAFEQSIGTFGWRCADTKE